jgi:hypothetical protein
MSTWTAVRRGRNADTSFDLPSPGGFHLPAKQSSSSARIHYIFIGLAIIAFVLFFWTQYSPSGGKQSLAEVKPTLQRQAAINSRTVEERAAVEQSAQNVRAELETDAQSKPNPSSPSPPDAPKLPTRQLDPQPLPTHDSFQDGTPPQPARHPATEAARLQEKAALKRQAQKVLADQQTTEMEAGDVEGTDQTERPAELDEAAAATDRGNEPDRDVPLGEAEGEVSSETEAAIDRNPISEEAVAAEDAAPSAVVDSSSDPPSVAPSLPPTAELLRRSAPPLSGRSRSAGMRDPSQRPASRSPRRPVPPAQQRAASARTPPPRQGATRGDRSSRTPPPRHTRQTRPKSGSWGMEKRRELNQQRQQQKRTVERQKEL